MTSTSEFNDITYFISDLFLYFFIMHGRQTFYQFYLLLIGFAIHTVRDIKIN